MGDDNKKWTYDEYTGRSYDHGEFPITCEKCCQTFETRTKYLDSTFPLGEGDGYFELPSGNLIEFRACECLNPLRIEIKNLRDTGPEGLKRREEFQRKLDFFSKVC